MDVQIKLGGIPSDVVFNEKATQYILDAINWEDQFICTFEGDLFEHGVTLRNKSHKLVFNVEIRKWLNIAEVDEGKVWTLNDLRDPKRDISVSDCKSYIAESFAKYVSNKKRPHFPRCGELCITKYKTDFYRALCIAFTAKEVTLFYIDHGKFKVVEYSNIRRFAVDFSRTEPLFSDVYFGDSWSKSTKMALHCLP